MARTIWVGKQTGERFIELRVSCRITARDFVQWLCMHHRDEFEDDELPERMSATKIRDIARKGIEEHGQYGYMDWSETLTDDESEEIEQWATRMVEQAMPELTKVGR